jgi:hypothetical protein
MKLSEQVGGSVSESNVTLSDFQALIMNVRNEKPRKSQQATVNDTWLFTRLS